VDKNVINALCNQILSALETVCVAGEQNHLQLMGVRRAVREIAREVNKEENNDG
jgi:hypothetical protein